MVLGPALTCGSETGNPGPPEEYGVSRHPTRARPVDSGEGKGAGPGAAGLQTKESPTRSRATELPPATAALPLPPRSGRSLIHRPAFPYLRGLLEDADKMHKLGAPGTARRKPGKAEPLRAWFRIEGGRSLGEGAVAPLSLGGEN